MFEKAKSSAIRTYNHVNERRGRYAAAATAVAAFALSRRAVDHWNEFLEEHELTDEYYPLG